MCSPLMFTFETRLRQYRHICLWCRHKGYSYAALFLKSRCKCVQLVCVLLTHFWFSSFSFDLTFNTTFESLDALHLVGLAWCFARKSRCNQRKGVKKKEKEDWKQELAKERFFSCEDQGCCHRSQEQSHLGFKFLKLVNMTGLVSFIRGSKQQHKSFKVNFYRI